MRLNKEQLLSRKDRTVEAVPVGADEVCVRSLSARELLGYENDIKAAEGKAERVLAVKLSWLVCDESGERMLTPDEAADMLNQRATVTTRLLKAGDKLNGWGEDVKGN